MLETLWEQMAATQPVQWVGMLTGVFGVWCSIKERVLAWPLFIVCYSCYIYISYQYGLRAFTLMNLVFVGISIYGWRKWSRNEQAPGIELPVSRMPRRFWPRLIALLAVLTVGVGWILSGGDESRVPYLDAFSMLCGFTAQWMLSRKHIETWLFWLITDIIYLVLLFQQGDWPSVLLFVVFIVLAVKGWWEWRKQLKGTSEKLH